MDMALLLALVPLQASQVPCPALQALKTWVRTALAALTEEVIMVLTVEALGFAEDVALMDEAASVIMAAMDSVPTVPICRPTLP